MRALAKKLALILRKRAASPGVRSSESEPAICCAPFQSLELLFISDGLHKPPCLCVRARKWAEREAIPRSTIYLEELTHVVTWTEPASVGGGTVLHGKGA
jgi:hypothetical protein